MHACIDTFNILLNSTSSAHTQSPLALVSSLHLYKLWFVAHFICFYFCFLCWGHHPCQATATDGLLHFFWTLWFNLQICYHYTVLSLLWISDSISYWITNIQCSTYSYVNISSLYSVKSCWKLWLFFFFFFYLKMKCRNKPHWTLNNWQVNLSR